MHVSKINNLINIFVSLRIEPHLLARMLRVFKKQGPTPEQLHEKTNDFIRYAQVMNALGC
jgi:hypothetical protein